MKNAKTQPLGVFLGLSLLLIFSSGSPTRAEAQPNNYVVIGAFSIKKNAVRFTSTAAKNIPDARYEWNVNRSLYYVYVLQTPDRQQAIAEALRLRSESPYNDTWVYNGWLGKSEGTEAGVDINPISAEEVKVTPADSASAAVQQTVSTPVREVIIEAPKEEPVAAVEDDKTKNFYFKVFRADNQEAVEGDITVIDTDRSRKMGAYASNRQIRVASPGSKSGSLSLYCEVFGYRKVQRDINYSEPAGEGITTDADANVLIPFELVRLQKGDIAVMYNVYFFKDAGIMRPESRYEVNSLLAMLKENPKYKIRIHGHTNGNAAGKIISKGPKSDNYFSLTDTKEGVGSAKKLSQVRAEIIREYLQANGIEAKRMEVKAWGGKRPLVDKLHTTAENNVRVEIEILEN
jgi:outer membrane protein OmpA-like peptidoglycan-associated protein